MNQADPILLNKQCNQQAFMVLHAVGAGIAFLSFASLCVFHTYLQVRARARRRTTLGSILWADVPEWMLEVGSPSSGSTPNQPANRRKPAHPTPLTGHRPRDLRLDPLQAHASHRHRRAAPPRRCRHPATITGRAISPAATSSGGSGQQREQWGGGGEGAGPCGGQYPAGGPGGGGGVVDGGGGRWVGVDRDGGGRGWGGHNDDGIVY